MHPLQHNKLSLNVKHLTDGGWFVSEFVWDGHEIVGESAEEYAAGWEVTLNGTRYTPHTPNIRALPFEQANEDSQHLTLKNQCTDTAVQIHHHILLQHDVCEQWIEIHNVSDTSVEVTNLNFAQLKLAPSFLAGAEVLHQYGQLLAPTTDNQFELHDPAVIFDQRANSWGIVVLNLAPAQTHRISTGTYTSIGYSNGATPFCHHIAPRQQFTSDHGVVLPYSNDSQAAIYQYTRDVLRPQRPMALPLTYCSWEPFHYDIDETRILQQIELAHDVGFETFVIDDGWAAHAGDWEVDTNKFPNGLAPILHALKSRKMQLGLWIGLATVHEDAQAYHEFQDCMIRDENGNERTTLVCNGKHALCCLASRYADHIEAKIHGLVRSLELGYIKIDLPSPFDVYHKPAIHCHSTDHDHAPGADYTLRAYRAIQRILHRLRETFPKLIIDVTFELWGGWHAIDPALTACADTCWLSNLCDTHASPGYAPADSRHLAASRSRLVSPEHIIAGNLQCDSPHPAESATSAFAAFPVLLGDLSAVTTLDRDTLRQLFQWFRTQRDQYQIAHHYAVLTPHNTTPSKHTWSGFLRCDANGNGILAIFRNLASTSSCSMPVKLPTNIEDDAVFTLTDAQTDAVVTTPAYALHDGLEIHLEHAHSFQLFAIQRV